MVEGTGLQLSADIPFRLDEDTTGDETAPPCQADGEEPKKLQSAEVVRPPTPTLGAYPARFAPWLPAPPG